MASTAKADIEDEAVHASTSLSSLCSTLIRSKSSWRSVEGACGTTVIGW